MSKRHLTNDLKTQQKGEIQKVGFLRKKGHVRRNWLDRWFVLTSEGMYYYKNRTDPKPIGVIPLFGASAAEDSLQKHQNVMTICTVEGKDYPIQASTRDEMLMWIKAIDDVVNARSQQPKEYQPPITQNPAAAGRTSKSSTSSEPVPTSSSGGATKHTTGSDSEDSD